jgi:hypothetical protein
VPPTACLLCSARHSQTLQTIQLLNLSSLSLSHPSAKELVQKHPKDYEMLQFIILKYCIFPTDFISSMKSIFPLLHSEDVSSS